MAKAVLPTFVGQAVRAHAAYIRALTWWEHRMRAVPERAAEFLLAHELDVVLRSAERQGWGKGKLDSLPAASALRKDLSSRFTHYQNTTAWHHARIAAHLKELLTTIGAIPVLDVDFPDSGVQPPGLSQAVRDQLEQYALSPEGAGLANIPMEPLSVEQPGQEWLLQGARPDDVFLLRKETRPKPKARGQKKTVLAVYSAGFQRQFSRLPFARQQAIASLIATRIDESYAGAVCLARAVNDPRSPFNPACRLNPRIIKRRKITGGADPRGIFTIHQSEYHRYFEPSGRVRLPPSATEPRGPEGKELLEYGVSLVDYLNQSNHIIALLTAHGEVGNAAKTMELIYPKFVSADDLQPALGSLAARSSTAGVGRLAKAMGHALGKVSEVAEEVGGKLKIAGELCLGFGDLVSMVKDPKFKDFAPMLKGLIGAGKSVAELAESLHNANLIGDRVARALIIDEATESVLNLFLSAYTLVDDMEKFGEAYDMGNETQMLGAGLMSASAVGSGVYTLGTFFAGGAAETMGGLAAAGPVGWVALGVLAIGVAGLVIYEAGADSSLEILFKGCFFGQHWDTALRNSDDVSEPEFRWGFPTIVNRWPVNRTEAWVRAAKPNFPRQLSALLSMLTGTTLTLDATRFTPDQGGGDSLIVSVSVPKLPADVVRDAHVTLVGYDSDGHRVWASEAPIPLFDLDRLRSFSDQHDWLMYGDVSSNLGHCFIRLKGTGWKSGEERAIPENTKYLEAAAAVPGLQAQLFALASQKPDRLEDLPVIRVRKEMP